MDLGNLPLLAKVREYKRRAMEIKSYLDRHPDEWPKFQAEVSSSIDTILLDILYFEKENIDGNEAKVYRLKKLFERQFRKYFLYGELVRWAFQKPYGYAGDFKIIDEIYLNQPKTTGLDRLFDNHFLAISTAIAIRNRKEDFKKIICDFILKNCRPNLRIMNLACGPGRDVKELLEGDKGQLFKNVSFDCYDYDKRALDHMKNLLNGTGAVNFIHQNAIRLALKREIQKEIPYKYDLIYSVSLFDHLDERVAIRLLNNLRKLLKPEGRIVIANMRDKHSNRSAFWMEWILDWDLIYRTEEEFKKIFIEARFFNVKIMLEKQRIIQYCVMGNANE